MNILMCGDVLGKSGRRAILENIESLRVQLKTDFIIVNGENAAHGFGITEKKLLQGSWKNHAERVLNNFPEYTAIDPEKVKNIWVLAKNNGDISWDIIMKLVNLGNFLEDNQFS